MFSRYNINFTIGDIKEYKQCNNIFAEISINYTTSVKGLSYSNKYILYSKDKLIILKSKVGDYSYDLILEIKDGLHSKQIVSLLREEILCKNIWNKKLDKM